MTVLHLSDFNVHLCACVCVCVALDLACTCAQRLAATKWMQCCRWLGTLTHICCYCHMLILHTIMLCIAGHHGSNDRCHEIKVPPTSVEVFKQSCTDSISFQAQQCLAATARASEQLAPIRVAPASAQKLCLTSPSRLSCRLNLHLTLLIMMTRLPTHTCHLDRLLLLMMCRVASLSRLQSNRLRLTTTTPMFLGSKIS